MKLQLSKNSASFFGFEYSEAYVKSKSLEGVPPSTIAEVNLSAKVPEEAELRLPLYSSISIGFGDIGLELEAFAVSKALKNRGSCSTEHVVLVGPKATKKAIESGIELIIQESEQNDRVAFVFISCKGFVGKNSVLGLLTASEPHEVQEPRATLDVGVDVKIQCDAPKSLSKKKYRSKISTANHCRDDPGNDWLSVSEIYSRCAFARCNVILVVNCVNVSTHFKSPVPLDPTSRSLLKNEPKESKKRQEIKGRPITDAEWTDTNEKGPTPKGKAFVFSTSRIEAVDNGEALVPKDTCEVSSTSATARALIAALSPLRPWKCEVCTLINSPELRKCEACGERKIVLSESIVDPFEHIDNLDPVAVDAWLSWALCESGKTDNTDGESVGAAGSGGGGGGVDVEKNGFGTGVCGSGIGLGAAPFISFLKGLVESLQADDDDENEDEDDDVEDDLVVSAAFTGAHFGFLRPVE
jgi:hypothetical protein